MQIAAASQGHTIRPFLRRPRHAIPSFRRVSKKGVSVGECKKEDVALAMSLCPDQTVKDGAKDTALVVAVMKTLNASLQMAGSASRGEVALALAKKAQSTSEVAQTATGSQALSSANFVIGNGLATASMAATVSKLAATGASPTRLATASMIGVAEKVVMAGGRAKLNERRTAVAALAVTTAATAAAGAATGGLAVVLAAAALASDMFAVYGACYADGKDGKDLVFM